jgi:hypothetical protein
MTRQQGKDRILIGHRTYQCHNPTCPARAWPDGTPKLLDDSHFTTEGRCRLRTFRAQPWPNGLGHDVYDDGKLVGEVHDDPVQEGVGVLTFDERGEPDRTLELGLKFNPFEAVLRCLHEGRPCKQEEA